jgi:hypothetical protein
VGPSGETLLEYGAFDALRSGFERIVLVVRPETEGAFRRRLESGLAGRAPVSYAHQRIHDLPSGAVDEPGREKPWGTAHAVLAARGHIDGPFAVVNADDFYGLESYVTIADFLSTRGVDGRRLGVLGFPVRDTLTKTGAVSRAPLRMNGDGELEEIVELPEVWEEGGKIVARTERGERLTLAGNELVSMNMWGLPEGFLSELESRFMRFLERPDRTPDSEIVLSDVAGLCVRDGCFRVDVLPARCGWFGMTFTEDRGDVQRKVARLVEAGEYPRNLWT